MTKQQAVQVATLTALDNVIARLSVFSDAKPLSQIHELRNDLGQLAVIVRRMVAPKPKRQTR